MDKRTIIQLFHAKYLCKNIDFSTCFKQTYGLFCKNIRVAMLSTLHRYQLYKEHPNEFEKEDNYDLINESKNLKKNMFELDILTVL